ncbi:lysoplasmalogenase [Arthrobacter sp.]|uniref:lysoplasmalogenase n=1 Tax=Arthrobacter sp. TaxID=1667 RepID=UPI0026E089DA|nr:lysoplasmalogenase [Arthrobacter sp.]MDO5754007.1 lysoplasmalogenase [Arthrobacter sp.]
MRSTIDPAGGKYGISLLPFSPYLIISIVHICALASNAAGLAAATKLVLMPALALALAWGWTRSGRTRGNVVWLLLAALFFSWLGDGAGAFFPFAPTLPLMLLFFALAHLCYMWTFWRHLAIHPAQSWAWLFAVWWVLLAITLWSPAGSLAPAVIGYGVVLGGTAALATRCHRTLIWGAIFFLASDTILAFRLFVPDAMPAWTSPLVMFTYTLGQGLIVAGALMTLRSHVGADSVKP